MVQLRRRQRAASCVIGTLLLFVCERAALARPDFSRSRITISPTAPAEGDVVTFSVEVTNSGDETAPFAEVKFELPLEAMFVGVDGFEKAEVNPQDKVLGGTMALGVGETRTFRVRMVIPRDAGGHVLTPDLTVRYLHQGVEFYGHEVYDIRDHLTDEGASLGGLRITPAGIAVLLFLIAFPVLWLLLRLLMPPGRVRDESGVVKGPMARVTGPATTAFAILLPLAFWTVFGVMAVRDWQSTHTWRETSCVITDSRVREQRGTSNQSSGSSFLSRTRSTGSRAYQALLALRYQIDGAEVVSTGFHTGSHLTVGGRARAESNLAAWPIDATVPCWVNPADRRDVVVRNGFGGAYLFALFPLPVAAFAFYRARAMLRRR